MLTPVLQQRKHSERLNRESERGDAGVLFHQNVNLVVANVYICIYCFYIVILVQNEKGCTFPNREHASIPC